MPGRGVGYSLVDALGEKSYEELMANRQNQSEAWEAMKTVGRPALVRVINLAQKLPDDKRQEIFRPDQLNQLLKALLSDRPSQVRLQEISQRIKDLDEQIKDTSKLNSVIERWKHERARLLKERHQVMHGIDRSHLDIADKIIDAAVSYINSEYQKMERIDELWKMNMRHLIELKNYAHAITMAINAEYERETELSELRKQKKGRGEEEP